MAQSKSLPRRTKNGRFSKRGKFVAVNGHLVPYVPTKRPSSPPARAARAPPPGRAAVEPPPSEPARARESLEPPAPTIQLGVTERRGARYTTWFRAAGTSGSISSLEGAGKSPDLIGESLEDAGAPAAFYSNQSGLLGRVKFDGMVPLDNLFDTLNAKLQFIGEETRGFDFRLAYREWSYKYQVVETLGPTDRVILEISDRRPKRGAA